MSDTHHEIEMQEEIEPNQVEVIEVKGNSDDQNEPIKEDPKQEAEEEQEEQEEASTTSDPKEEEDKEKEQKPKEEAEPMAEGPVPEVNQEENHEMYKTPYFDSSDKWYTPITKPFFHTLYLLEKNLILHIRNWKTTLAQILAPIIVIAVMSFLAFVVGLASTKPEEHPAENTIDYSKIVKCKPYVTDTCITLAWAHNNNNFADEVMNKVVSHYKLEAADIKKFDYEVELMDWMVTHQNQTGTAISFSNYTAGFGFPTQDLRSTQTTRYTIFYNKTTPVPTVAADNNVQTIAIRTILDNFIMWHSNGYTPTENDVMEIKADWRGFPTFPAIRNGQVEIFSRTGSSFFCLSAMIGLIVAMHQIVVEKEQKLRFGMNMMGLSTTAYWISWATTFLIMSFLTTLATMAAGYAFQVFVFLRSDFISLFILFFVFQVTVISLAFLMSTFFNNGKTALIIGFVVLAATFILNQFLAAQEFVYVLYAPDCLDVDATETFCVDSWVVAIRYLLNFYPPFNFAKYFTDAIQTTQPVYNAQLNAYENSEDMFTLARAFQKSDITGTFILDNVPAAFESIGWLVLNMIIFLVLGVYFDAILPKPSGAREHPFFFLFPSYWGISLKKKNQQDEYMRNHYIRRQDELEKMDDDQQREYYKTRNPDIDASVRFFNLKREFVTNFGLPLISKTVSAVDGLDLHVPKGSCLGLLGHNGAGKTTTFNMLIGLFQPTYGDITVNGVSIRDSLDGVRRQLGVCPQHDILWGEMTPYQHLKLFARLRGLPWKFIKNEINERLHAVKLYSVRNKQVKTFSGGMKRRLTVAISLIGSPPIVILDEPTTGLDPKSRNNVWELINSMKKVSTLILTSHSMQEADALADRIAIMADGKLRCVGNSLELKAKYGAGYNLTLVANEGRDTDLKAFVDQYLPAAKLFREDAGSMIYNVLPEYLKEVGEFLKVVESVTKANSQFEKSKQTKKRKRGARQQVAAEPQAPQEKPSEEEAVKKQEATIEEQFNLDELTETLNVSPDTFKQLMTIIKDWEISYTTLEQVFHASLPHADEE